MFNNISLWFCNYQLRKTFEWPLKCTKISSTFQNKFSISSKLFQLVSNAINCYFYFHKTFLIGLMVLLPFYATFTSLLYYIMAFYFPTHLRWNLLLRIPSAKQLFLAAKVFNDIKNIFLLTIVVSFENVDL